MKTLYIDKDIIVCEKPYGVSSQASNAESMLDLIATEHGIIPFVVHRLDVTTTGVMVYALNEKSASHLSAQVAGRELEKEYLAIVHGKTDAFGEMRDYLYHDRHINKSFIADKARRGVKEARLEYKTLAYLEDKGLSLVKIKLLTGRTHQIRVQLSSRGFSLYGDGKYGAKDNDKIALHSHSIAFKHPQDSKFMTFSSFPPNTSAWAFFDNIEALIK